MIKSRGRNPMLTAVKRVLTTLSLGWKEFARAFTKRAPGGRDFFWMTTLLFLLQVLALIVFSAREGVLERSVDAFLGNEPDYGVPIWTRPNAVGFGGLKLISEGLIDGIEADDFKAVPFRRLRGPEVVAMPSPLVWKSGAGQSEKETFIGIAADFDGPLYPAIHLPPSPTRFGELADQLWTIVLDSDQFARHFDLGAYRTSLEGRIPPGSFQEIPAELENLTEMPLIWLNTRTPFGKRLTPFRVVWARYLGIGTEKHAYVVDRRWYVAMSALEDNPALCVDVTTGPGLYPGINSVKSSSKLMMQAEEKAKLGKLFETAMTPVAAEFGGKIVLGASRDSWKPEKTSNRSSCDPIVPATTLAFYLDDAGLTTGPCSDEESGADVQLCAIPEFKGFAMRNTGFSAPCNLLDPEILRKPDTRQDKTAEGCIAHVSATPKGRGYSEMLLFASERDEIDILLDYINCGELEVDDIAAASEGSDEDLCERATTPQGEIVQSRLMLSEVYQDSLHRLAFLTRLFETISGPIGVSLLLLLVAILWVQIGTVVDHRRHDYALLLANGLSPRQLTSMVTLQLMLGVLFSMAIALVVFGLLKLGMYLWSLSLSVEFERILLGRSIDVLPLAALDIGKILGIVLVLSMFFARRQMQRSGVTLRRSLEDLLR